MDIVQMAFGFYLQGFRHRIQHIHGLVDPAALFLRRGKNFAQGRPEPQGPVTDGHFRVLLQAASLEIEQPFTPALGAFSKAVGHRQQLLVAILIHCPAVHVYMHERGRNDHQNALFFLGHPRL